MPTLPKHLRPRWRYLAVGIESWPDASLDRGTFQRHLWYAAQNLVGDVGSARSDLSVLGFAFDAPTGEAVVRARHGHVEEARAVLACLDEVQGDPLGLSVRGVGGTVRTCEDRYCPRLAGGGSDEERYLGRPGEATEERTVVFDGVERPAIVRGNRADVRTDDGYTGATRFDLE
jgi:ribonuclease P/MRP protein subunit POP5